MKNETMFNVKEMLHCVQHDRGNVQHDRGKNIIPAEALSFRKKQ
jgi:hypothetical protein